MNEIEQASEADKNETTTGEAKNDPSKGLLSLKRVAEAIGVSTPTARRLVTTGKLLGVKLMVNDRLCWKVKPESLQTYLNTASAATDSEAKKKATRSAHPVKSASQDFFQSTNSVPLDTHKSALETARLALERLERVESQAEEQRNRAELAERQKLALEMELRQYQAALSEQSESLAEARAEKQAAELQLAQQSGPPPEFLRVETHRPTFGQRVKGWFGFKAAR